jgi:hypothetical protein
VVAQQVYSRYARPGCLILFFPVVVAAVYFVSEGSHRDFVWSILIGVLIAVVLSVVLSKGTVWALNRWRPKPLVFEKHVLRENPAFVVELVNFLDSVREVQVWSEAQDRQLDTLISQESLDDSLVSAALMVARELRARLSTPPKTTTHISEEIRALDISGLREELAAILADLRVAAS